MQRPANAALWQIATHQKRWLGLKNSKPLGACRIEQDFPPDPHIAGKVLILRQGDQRFDCTACHFGPPRKYQPAIVRFQVIQKDVARQQLMNLSAQFDHSKLAIGAFDNQRVIPEIDGYLLSRLGAGSTLAL